MKTSKFTSVPGMTLTHLCTEAGVMLTPLVHEHATMKANVLQKP